MPILTSMPIVSVSVAVQLVNVSFRCTSAKIVLLCAGDLGGT